MLGTRQVNLSTRIFISKKMVINMKLAFTNVPFRHNSACVMIKKCLHTWSPVGGPKLEGQGFIQAILMPGRQQKKLNLLTEFSNLIFVKFYFKAYWCWICLQNKLAYLTSFFYFKLFLQFFSGALPPELPPELRHEPVAAQHLKTPTCILTFENSMY